MQNSICMLIFLAFIVIDRDYSSDLSRDIVDFFVVIASCIALWVFFKNLFLICKIFYKKLNDNLKKEVSRAKMQISILILVLCPLLLECLIISYLKSHGEKSNPFILDTLFSIACSITAAVFLWLLLAHLFCKYSTSINELKTFFNCLNKNQIRIYFSNAIGYAQDGMKMFEFEAGMCSFLEICAINKITEIFSKHPNKSFDMTRGLVDSIWETSMPRVITDVSEHQKNNKPRMDYKCGSVVVVGSTNKNLHRRYYYRIGKLTLKFPWENSTHSKHDFSEAEKLKKNVYFNRVRTDDKVYNFLGEYNIAIIEKIYDAGTAIFFCAGVRADDSLMAVEYLFNNWKDLHELYDKKYSDGFAICIGREFTEELKMQFEHDKIIRLLTPDEKGDGKTMTRNKNINRIDDIARYETIEKDISISTSQLKDISTAFRQAVVYASQGHGDSCLSFIDSKFIRPSGNERGEFIALDIGGTNVRANIISLSGNHKYRATDPETEKLSSILCKDPKMPVEAFFDNVVELIVKIITIGCNYKIGHTFSFPCNHETRNKAKLKRWTKEIEIAGAVNKDINEILDAALSRANVSDIKTAAIINDTIGVLLAKGYSSNDVSIGSICGTGHNSAFFNTDGQAINLESGNFDSDVLRVVTPKYLYDAVYHTETKGQIFEKMVSGAYLPHLFAAILEHHNIEHASDNHPKTAQDIASFALDATHCGGLKSAIAQDLLIRSARLIAASYHGIILYLDPEVERQHVIAIDGSLFCESIIFSAALREAINELFEGHPNQIHLERCPDFSALGAAVAAAMAEDPPKVAI